MVDPERGLDVGVADAEPARQRVGESEERDVGGEGHRHRGDAEYPDEDALTGSDEGSSRHGHEYAEDRRLLARTHGEHPAERVGADHRQVELARDHGESQREREQPELGEALERVVDVEGSERLAGFEGGGQERCRGQPQCHGG